MGGAQLSAEPTLEGFVLCAEESRMPSWRLPVSPSQLLLSHLLGACPLDSEVREDGSRVPPALTGSHSGDRHGGGGVGSHSPARCVASSAAVNSSSELQPYPSSPAMLLLGAKKLVGLPEEVAGTSLCCILESANLLSLRYHGAGGSDRSQGSRMRERGHMCPSVWGRGCILPPAPAPCSVPHCRVILEADLASGVTKVTSLPFHLSSFGRKRSCFSGLC